jgi:hypothetical protein
MVPMARPADIATRPPENAFGMLAVVLAVVHCFYRSLFLSFIVSIAHCFCRSLFLSLIVSVVHCFYPSSLLIGPFIFHSHTGWSGQTCEISASEMVVVSVALLAALLMFTLF